MQNNTFSTLFVGQNLIKLSSVDSTNDYLKKLTSNSEPLPEGTVIMAEHQLAGRGQFGNVWQTEPGKNLTFSVLLKPTFLKLENHFMLNIMVSVALNQVLSRYVCKGLSIKWPNDIYFEDKKLGGILIENAIMSGKIKHTIIGIGLNINQLNFAPDLEKIAKSLSQILQQDVDLQIVLSEICTQIEQSYLKLKAGKYALLKELYVNNLYRLNKQASYINNGEVFEGVILGVSNLGLLSVKPLNAEPLEFNFKEIVFL